MHPKRQKDRQARADRRAAVRELAWSQHGVVSRPQLLALGLTRWEIKAELRGERWRAHGRQTIATHTGALTAGASMWRGVFEGGPRAVVDGVSALVAAGLTGFEADRVRVSVPRGARRVRRRGLVVRETRRLMPSDVIPAGLPRTRPPVAAVRAALWARSDRQAALALTMTVQQRIATAEQIAVAFQAVRRHGRRNFIAGVLMDLLDGVQAMGELDFARKCRERGLPEPDRQVIRQASKGRIYLDVYWSRWGVVVEIEGIHHLQAEVAVADALRQNAVTLEDALVLRLPVLGLRVAEDDFFAQITEALVSRGYRLGLRPSA